MTNPRLTVMIRHPGCMQRRRWRRPASLVAALAAAFLVALPARGAAQVGTTTDILTGAVTDPAGNPLEGADVEAMSLETEISRHARTNEKGRYTIVFPDGGGQYRVTVRFIGMAPVQVTVARQADEDRLVSDVRMSPTAERLATVTVRGRRNAGRGGDRRTPGSTERDITAEMAARLPIDASDLNALATLAPGVVGIDATDSTDAAFSVAGLRPTANSVTLDGLSIGSGSVPQDAVRSTRVVTSTYDVARGGFSGGLVASTTRGGANVPEGSFTYTLRDQSLAWG
ncbi:MAG TPA: carboxypeptidase-like regulatory domain-containing protein, partial [Ramlibacter sp.]|nr:carboxypeptidase-like regulatory domain-containing protein [Ramlibacter sp.]